MRNSFLKYLIIFPVIFTSCTMGSSSEQVDLESTVIERIRTKAKGNILVCAHRGSNKHYPENSISTVKASILKGVDIIELDVRTTRDDSLVIMHDADIDRTTSGSGYVSTMTYEDLIQYNLLHADTLTSETVPTLRQILKITVGKEVILNLDLKDIDLDDYYNLVKEFNMEHEVISYVWDKELINQILEKDSLYAVLPLANNIREVNYYNEYIPSKLIHLTDESYQDDIIQEAKNNSQLIFINSLWEKDEQFMHGRTAQMDSLISKEPAIIQTDYPEELADYLEQLGWRK